MRSAAKVVGVVAAVLAIGGCRNTLVYYPTRAPEVELVLAAQERGLVPWMHEGRRIGWRPASSPDSARRIIVFHGNAGHSLHREYLRNGFQLVREEWDVYLFEYPGFGSRPGRPGEETLVAAGFEAVDALMSEDPSRPVSLLGESLGSGVAAQVAAGRSSAVSGMLLITPFTSIVDAAAARFPRFLVRAVLTDRYDSERALEGYAGRVAVLVAGRDTVVPADLGRRLYKGYGGPKRLWVQEQAGHNSLDYTPGAAWWAQVSAFLAGHSM